MPRKDQAKPHPIRKDGRPNPYTRAKDGTIVSARGPRDMTLYGDPEALIEKARAYFKVCATTKEAPTKTALALFLGYANTSGVTNLGRRGPEWQAVLNWIHSMVTKWHEQKVLKDSDYRPSLNWLKQNHPAEWGDAETAEAGVSITINASFIGTGENGPRVIEGEAREIRTTEPETQTDPSIDDPADVIPAAKSPQVRKRARPARKN